MIQEDRRENARRGCGLQLHIVYFVVQNCDYRRDYYLNDDYQLTTIHK